MKRWKYSSLLLHVLDKPVDGVGCVIGKLKILVLHGIVLDGRDYDGPCFEKLLQGRLPEVNGEELIGGNNLLAPDDCSAGAPNTGGFNVESGPDGLDDSVEPPDDADQGEDCGDLVEHVQDIVDAGRVHIALEQDALADEVDKVQQNDQNSAVHDLPQKCEMEDLAGRVGAGSAGSSIVRVCHDLFPPKLLVWVLLTFAKGYC